MTASDYEQLVKEDSSLKVGDIVMAWWRSAGANRKGQGTITKLNRQTVRVEVMGAGGGGASRELSLPRIGNIKE